MAFARESDSHDVILHESRRGRVVETVVIHYGRYGGIESRIVATRHTGATRTVWAGKSTVAAVAAELVAWVATPTRRNTRSAKRRG